MVKISRRTKSGLVRDQKYFNKSQEWEADKKHKRKYKLHRHRRRLKKMM